jgi:hypothetical protein
MPEHMIVRMGIVFFVLLAITCPVQAFTAKNLDITVQDNTNAVITFDYDLSWYENIAVFSNVMNPGAELAKALKSQYRKDVTVNSVTVNQAQVTVGNFATLRDMNGVVSMNTPELSFHDAQHVLDKYWFARFISPDFSPEITTVRFPDGYSETFSNQELIPAIRHVIVT